MCRRSRPVAPIRTRWISHVAPAERTSDANDSSERTSPGVVASETSAMSGGSVKVGDCNLARVPKPLVSVVVPTSNRADYLTVTLDSLAAQDLEDGAYEVIVVDDGSSDRTPSVIEAAGVRSVRRDSAQGPNAARNTGVRVAGADLIAMVDDDVWAPPGWLRSMVEGAERHPEAGALGGAGPPALRGPPPPPRGGGGAPPTTPRPPAARPPAGGPLGGHHADPPGPAR